MYVPTYLSYPTLPRILPGPRLQTHSRLTPACCTPCHHPCAVLLRSVKQGAPHNLSQIHKWLLRRIRVALYCDVDVGDRRRDMGSRHTTLRLYNSRTEHHVMSCHVISYGCADAVNRGNPEQNSQLTLGPWTTYLYYGVVYICILFYFMYIYIYITLHVIPTQVGSLQRPGIASSALAQHPHPHPHPNPNPPLSDSLHTQVNGSAFRSSTFTCSLAPSPSSRTPHPPKPEQKSKTNKTSTPHRISKSLIPRSPNNPQTPHPSPSGARESRAPSPPLPPCPAASSSTRLTPQSDCALNKAHSLRPRRAAPRVNPEPRAPSLSTPPPIQSSVLAVNLTSLMPMYLRTQVPALISPSLS